MSERASEWVGGGGGRGKEERMADRRERKRRRMRRDSETEYEMKTVGRGFGGELSEGQTYCYRSQPARTASDSGPTHRYFLDLKFRPSKVLVCQFQQAVPPRQ